MISHEPDERRLFARFPARFPARLKDGRDPFGTKFQIRDASAMGARFESRDQYRLNDVLTLEVQLPDKKDPMAFKGRVVWAKSQSPSKWDIGLQFETIDLFRMHRLYHFFSDMAYAGQRSQ